MKTFKNNLILLIILLFGYTSCVKKELEADNELESSLDVFLASAISNDMVNIADEAARTFSIGSFKTNAQSGLLANCATLTFDTLIASNVDTITVDFGSSNCMGNDGRNRRGKIQILFSGNYRDSLNKITVTPINYFVNDNGVSGVKTITNLGHNFTKHLIYEIKDNLTIVRADGKGNITHFAIRNREWYNGENTLTWDDDVYLISGNANGVSSTGREYRSNITKLLTRNMAPGCRKYFTVGEIGLTPLGKATRTINFGNGLCDNVAIVSVNGKEYEITLP
ncbi:MAG: hypothetical protein IPM51_06025 [Sphingobacteriaceae bacterium]|nr:hypothetical protein [Sphingobacteriaceae bacterium]